MITNFVGKNAVRREENALIVAMVIVVMAKRELILIGMATVPLAQLRHLAKAIGVLVEVLRRAF